MIDHILSLGLKRPIPDLYYAPFKKGGVVLNVGAGNSHIEGAISLDKSDKFLREGDIVWDADEKKPLPFADETVDGIHAHHFLEHVEDPLWVLSEFQRVLRRSGVVQVTVPYYRSQLAFQDLTHRTFWTEETWRNTFQNPYYDTAKGYVAWEFEVGFNLIAGLVERNLMLLTQLVKK